MTYYYVLYPAIATRIPEDILTRVIKHIFPNFDHIDPQVLAGPLYNEDLVTFNEFCTITNDRISLVERINTLLYKVLPSKGDQRNTIVRFYRSLLKSGVPQSIATDLRCVGEFNLLLGVDRIGMGVTLVSTFL